MGKSKLDNMSCKRILEEVGSYIYADQLLEILKDINDFFEKDRTSSNDVLEYITENDSKINKEKLVYKIAQNLKCAVETSKKPTTRIDAVHSADFESKYKKCLELLKDSNVEVPVIEIENSITRIQKFETMEDLTGTPMPISSSQIAQNSHNKNTFEKMKKENILDELLIVSRFPIGVENFICYDYEQGNLFSFIIVDNSSTLLNKFVKNNGENSEGYKMAKAEILYQQNLNILEKYTDKFDMDTFMLFAAYNAQKLLSHNELEDDEKEICIKILNFANENIENRACKISSCIKINDEKEMVQYSIKELEDDVSRIIDDEFYISKPNLLEIKNQILAGKIEWDADILISHEISKKVWKLMKFTPEEKRKLIQINPKNIQYLYHVGDLSEEELKGQLQEIQDCELDSMFVEELYYNQTIDKQNIINLYMKNNLRLADIMNFSELYNLESQVNVEELMKYYAEAKTDTENEKDFERYSLLFRELRMKNSTDDEKLDLAEGIVEKIYEIDGDEQDFKKLYDMYLLPIKTLTEWNGNDIIYDLVSNAELKPKDAKDLLKNGELDLKKVNEALKKSRLSDEQKVDFVFRCFDNVEDEVYLFQSINIAEDLRQDNYEQREGTPRGPRTPEKSREERTLNPKLRWELVSLIDEDYTSKVYEDGTVEFTLPNVKGGTILLEKMLKKTKQGIKLQYGAATYWISQEEFNNNKDEIIIGKSVNRRKLIELYTENQTVEKTVHNGTWGEQIMRKLEIMKDGYSQEKIQTMQNICNNIQKDYERQK